MEWAQHRVILHPGQERYSAITFHMPNYHTVIENCMKNEEPQYVPVVAGEFLLKREALFYGDNKNWVDHEKNVENTENYFKKIPTN